MLILMAHGPNDIAIPIRIFRSATHAQDFVEKWMIPKYVAPVVRQGQTIWRINGHKLDPELAEALFTEYDGGCGEAGAFSVVSVPLDSAFLSWDLD